MIIELTITESTREACTIGLLVILNKIIESIN